jgi:uncharacterized protein YehS (DUF1456 family)
MDNNYIFYKLRKIYKWDEEKIGNLFKSVEFIVSPLDIFAWMKQEQYEGFKEMPDQPLAALLNGFIVEQRGLKDGVIPIAEEKLTNNIIFRKLRIALNFKDDDIIETLKKADIRIGKPELNAFFRDPKHSHYRVCGDQFLRNFLRGLQLESYQNQK